MSAFGTIIECLENSDPEIFFWIFTDHLNECVCPGDDTGHGIVQSGIAQVFKKPAKTFDRTGQIGVPEFRRYRIKIIKCYR